jgi:hypothetical protein
VRSVRERPVTSRAWLYNPTHTLLTLLAERKPRGANRHADSGGCELQTAQLMKRVHGVLEQQQHADPHHALSLLEAKQVSLSSPSPVIVLQHAACRLLRHVQGHRRAAYTCTVC